MSETPVIVGVGDIINRHLAVHHAAEPAELMLDAISIALQDTGLSLKVIATLKPRIDSIDVVRTWTWPYPDLPGLLAEKLGARPTHSYCSPHAGNQSAKLVDDAARRIASGETRLAVVTGGEALASLAACAKAGVMPPPNWTPVEKPATQVFAPSMSEMAKGIGSKHMIGAPIQVYPLFENGLRAQRGQSMEDNNTESAKLYAEFAQVANKNPLAWNFPRTAETEQTIGRVSSRNRMICFPYPLLMNAFNTINLAGAMILTSVSYARELGVAKDRWIYVLGGAGTQDSDNFWERPDFHSSPAISRALDAGLEASGLSKSDIDMFDFYSCFPIVPKLACLHLGLDMLQPEKPITLLGGLTSFGGAGNNYSMHAMTVMTRKLRAGSGTHGLVLANGGVLTYQHVICLSSRPRADGQHYPARNPLPSRLEDNTVPKIDETAEGEAIIETYTVDFDRKNEPSLGHILAPLSTAIMTATGSSPEVPKRPKGILKNNSSYMGEHSSHGPQPPTNAHAFNHTDSVGNPDRPPMNREMSEKEVVQMNTEINAGGRRNSSNPRSSMSRRQSAVDGSHQGEHPSPRLKWDEGNLFLNESQMGGKMKIDEPKTPYVGRYDPDEDEEPQNINPDDLMVDELDKAKVLEGDAPQKRKPREVDIPDLDIGEPEQDTIERRHSDTEKRVIVDPDQMDIDGARHGETPENIPQEEREKHEKFENMRKKHYEMHNIKNLLGHGAEELDDDE
ncbi:hypothetical protein KCU85_g3074, partial [Aureobasidium melanogenum]